MQWFMGLESAEQVVVVDPLDFVWNSRLYSFEEYPGQDFGGATKLHVIYIRDYAIQ